ncbi:hypothetical protein E6B08_17475 [Pseudomonas putida]|uniref:HNH endonuclease n=1 Tax=Pseudomonas putida TaxID=303 RepID=A0A4D6XFL3_PSEPU|nr:hypothetical protein [Pseudomonas putida]QCI13051.1 hypothetical protein E6B08_17475 [Pseudomonas putida]
MTSPTEPKKKSRRINFSKNTKLELAKRAGFLCSYPSCLRFTTGPAVNTDGEDSAAGIAVAAHIYPASEGGPRKQEGVSPDQIKDISNGIWLCGTHGILIDEFQDDFPPEAVIEMKGVREFAQRLTIIMNDVGELVSQIGPQRLDEIVWNHWPNPDEQSVRREFVSAALKCYRIQDEAFGTRMPLPPDCFELKPLMKAAAAVAQPVVETREFISPDNYRADRRRAIRIVTSWAAEMKKYGWDGKGLYANDVYVKITTRNPETGEVAEPFMWVQGTCVSEHDYNVMDGETATLAIDNTAHRASNFDWRLTVNLKDGECRTESTLHMGPSITPRHSHEMHERAEVEAYSQLLESMANGWEPIGFVGLEAGQWSEPDSIHPEAFAIRCEVTKEQMEKAIQRCAKVKLGYELAETWNHCFYFNDIFFSDVLDEATIRRASDNLLAKLGAERPFYTQSAQIVALNYRFGIRLTLKGGNMFFQQALSETLRHSRW